MTTQRVLIVDDDQDTLDVYKMFLSKHYEVRIATSAKDAFKILMDHCPDLVLLDLMLPGVSGIQVARWMRSYEGVDVNIPILFFTGYRVDEEMDSYLKQEFNNMGLLKKPVDLPRLDEVIGMAIGKSPHPFKSAETAWIG